MKKRCIILPPWECMCIPNCSISIDPIPELARDENIKSGNLFSMGTVKGAAAETQTVARGGKPGAWALPTVDNTYSRVATVWSAQARASR